MDPPEKVPVSESRHKFYSPATARPAGGGLGVEFDEPQAEEPVGSPGDASLGWNVAFQLPY